MDNYLQWLESEHEALRELAIEYAIKDDWQTSEVWSERAGAVGYCLMQYRAFLETGDVKDSIVAIPNDRSNGDAE